jgi:hypothetical protein
MAELSGDEVITKNGSVISRDEAEYFKDNYHQFLQANSNSTPKVSFSDFLREHFDFSNPKEDSKDTKTQSLYPNIQADVPDSAPSDKKEPELKGSKPLSEFANLMQNQNNQNQPQNTEELIEMRTQKSGVTRGRKKKPTKVDQFHEEQPKLELPVGLNLEVPTKKGKKITSEIDNLKLKEKHNEDEISVIESKVSSDSLLKFAKEKHSEDSIIVIESKVRSAPRTIEKDIPIINCKADCKANCGPSCMTEIESEISRNFLKHVCKYATSLKGIAEHFQDSGKVGKFLSLLENVEDLNKKSTQEFLEDQFSVDDITASSERMEKFKNDTKAFVEMLKDKPYSVALMNELTDTMTNIASEKIAAKRETIDGFFEEFSTRTLTAGLVVYSTSARNQDLSDYEINGDASELASSIRSNTGGSKNSERLLKAVCVLIGGFCYVIGNDYNDEIQVLLGKKISPSPTDTASQLVESKFARDRALGFIKNQTVNTAKLLMDRDSSDMAIRAGAQRLMSRVIKRKLNSLKKAQIVLLKLYIWCLEWIASKDNGAAAVDQLDWLKEQFLTSGAEIEEPVQASQTLHSHLVQGALKYIKDHKLEGEFTILLPENVEEDFVSHVVADTKKIRTLVKSHLIAEKLSDVKEVRNCNMEPLYCKKESLTSKGCVYNVSKLKKRFTEGKIVLNMHSIDEILS